MPGGAISCTQGLPPNILSMFKSEEDLGPPLLVDKPKMPPYTGLAAFVPHFTPKDEDDYKPVIKETPPERRARKAEKRKREGAVVAAKAAEDYKPHENEDATEDAFKTLFVGRLSYGVDDRKLKREMERYGRVKKLRLVNDSKSGKPRGYAFVEFEDERDMKVAYKQADGMRIDGKRVVVDVERGRTVKGWKPRRLGGGLGGTRIGSKRQNQNYSGREPFDTGRSGGSSSYRSSGGDRGRSDRDRRDDRRRDDRDRRDDRRRDDRDRRDDRRRDDRDRGRDRDRDRGRDRDRDRGRDRDRR